MTSLYIGEYLSLPSCLFVMPKQRSQRIPVVRLYITVDVLAQLHVTSASKGYGVCYFGAAFTGCQVRLGFQNVSNVSIALDEVLSVSLYTCELAVVSSREESACVVTSHVPRAG